MLILEREEEEEEEVTENLERDPHEKRDFFSVPRSVYERMGHHHRIHFMTLSFILFPPFDFRLNFNLHRMPYSLFIEKLALNTSWSRERHIDDPSSGRDHHRILTWLLVPLVFVSHFFYILNQGFIHCCLYIVVDHARHKFIMWFRLDSARIPDSVQESLFSSSILHPYHSLGIFIPSLFLLLPLLFPSEWFIEW